MSEKIQLVCPLCPGLEAWPWPLAATVATVADRSDTAEEITDTKLLTTRLNASSLNIPTSHLWGPSPSFLRIITILFFDL